MLGRVGHATPEVALLRTVVVSNETGDFRKVLVEPYGRQFVVPPHGLLEIVVERDEQRVEINIGEQTTSVWLFEAGDIQVFTREQLDETRKLARERDQTERNAK